MGEVGLGADEEAARIVWEEGGEKTEAEVQLGKALAPLDAWEIDEQMGALWVPASRVGLWQRDSVRPIDDFSVFGQTQWNHLQLEVWTRSPLSSRCSLQRLAIWSGSARGDDEFDVIKDNVGGVAGQVVGRTSEGL